MAGQKFVAPSFVVQQQPTSVGAETTAPIAGVDPRGQVLGVPENYVPPGYVRGDGPVSWKTIDSERRHGEQPNVVPIHTLYREIDAWAPASNPADIPDLQQKLIAAGLLSPTDAGYVPGQWGEGSVQAYRALLSMANVNGTDSNTMLSYLVHHPGYDPNATKQIQLSSPISLAQAFEQTYKATLGHKPSSSETAQFVHAYQQYENEALTGQAAAQSAFAKNPAAAPTSITDAASPGDYAQNYIDTQFAGQESNVGAEHGLDLITNLISSTKGAGG